LLTYLYLKEVDQFLRISFDKTLLNSEKALPSKIYNFLKKEKRELQTAQNAGAFTKRYLVMTQATTALQQQVPL